MEPSTPTAVTADRPVCRCGHPKVWHRRPGQTTGIDPDDRWGECEITGPQSGDGCDCAEYAGPTDAD